MNDIYEVVSVGRDFVSAISDGDKDMETVGTVLGGIAGGALGVSFVDGLFSEDDWKTYNIEKSSDVWNKEIEMNKIIFYKIFNRFKYCCVILLII